MILSSGCFLLTTFYYRKLKQEVFINLLSIMLSNITPTQLLITWLHFMLMNIHNYMDNNVCSFAYNAAKLSRTEFQDEDTSTHGDVLLHLVK